MIGQLDLQGRHNMNEALKQLKPRRSKFIPDYIKPTPKQTAFMIPPHREALYGGAAGSGKILSKDGVVLTPFGFKKNKDLKIGDRINNPDGTTQRIIQLRPWVKLEKWTVHFSDGTSTEVAADHLWLAWRSGKRKKLPKGKECFGDSSAEVIETRELKQWLDTAVAQEAKGHRPNWPLIPVCKEQVFNVTLRFQADIDPYILGMWLGDGHWSAHHKCSMVGITSNDHKHMGRVLKEYSYSHNAKYRYDFTKESSTKIKAALTRLKLAGTKADTKFIPREFLMGTIETRYAVLQGLMDTDGTVDKNGKLSFCSVSKQLAEDVCFLVRSLGGTATTTKKKPFYKNADGEKVFCKTAYIIYIKHPQEKKLFRLLRKKKRCNETNELMHKAVVGVEIGGEIYGRCLTVSNPNGLYITNDFIVTHNSIVLSYMALQYADIPGYNGIIFRRTLTEANLAGSVMDILIEWLSPRMGRGGDVKFDGSYNTFYFLEYGSQLTIAYLKNEIDHERYKGSSYHNIFFDELTDFSENQYRFLNRSLRRSLHGPSANIPLRIRCATNPGGLGHCVPYGDVLTPEGWKDIKDFKIGDSVYEVNPQGNLVESTVSQLHKYKAPKLLTTNIKGFHLSCTPEHKVAYVSKRKKGYSNYSLREFDKLPGQACILRSVSWKGKNPKVFKVPEVVTRKRKIIQPKTLKWSNYCNLLGWYLSEGSVVDRDKAFVISQKKKLQRREIRRLLDRCGFTYSTDKNNFIVYCPDWYNYFSQFGRSWNKFIPNEVLNSTTKNLKILFKALMGGDGHWYGETSGQYYTTSKQLSDDVLTLAVKLGYITDCWHRDRGPGGGAKTRRRSYQVSFKKTKSGGTELLTGNHIYDVTTETKRKSSIVESEYNKTVYCLGVPKHHTFVIRQKGYVWVSGNCWVKSRFRIQKCTECCGRDNAWRGHHADRPFVQATLKDNPHIDQSAYTMALNEMGEIDRLRMKDGDWDVSAGARFKDEWFTNRWDIRGAYFYVPQIDRRWHRSGCEIFITMDVAASTRDGVANTNFRVNQERSYTVMSVWAKTPDNYLLWLDQVRIQAEVPDILQKLIQVARSHKPSKIIVDAQGIGKGVAQMAEFLGLPVDAVPTVSDKIQNSVTAQTRAKKGKIILPAFSPWLDILTGELFTWTGHPHETDDQIDALSNAALYVQQQVTFGEREYDTQPATLPTTKGEGWSNGYVGNNYPDTPFFSGEESYNPFSN
jgi:predicted phage terminase large subunit-like protein